MLDKELLLEKLRMINDELEVISDELIQKGMRNSLDDVISNDTEKESRRLIMLSRYVNTMINIRMIS